MCTALLCLAFIIYQIFTYSILYSKLNRKNCVHSNNSLQIVGFKYDTCCPAVLARKEVWIQPPVQEACLQIVNLHTCPRIQFNIFLKIISFHFLLCIHLLSNSARHEKVDFILLGICLKRASRFFEKNRRIFFLLFQYFYFTRKDEVMGQK